MQIKNAIRKCEKAGFTVTENGNRFDAVRGEREGIRFFRNGGPESTSATCFHTINPDTGEGKVFGWRSITEIIQHYDSARIHSRVIQACEKAEARRIEKAEVAA